jgi:predicted dithiol-disulfide oxidoreductase (DUF899 family)
MRQFERVAELRRRLPEGAVVEDYQFAEVPAELGAGDEPDKTVRLDHITQNVDFAIAAAADVPALRAHARSRGWKNLRLLSCGNSTFKFDMASEDAEGNQDSTISVFTRDSSGTLRHFYSGHPWLAGDVKQRGIDQLTPVYNMLDLTPQGCDDWYASLSYSGREVRGAV